MMKPAPAARVILTLLSLTGLTAVSCVDRDPLNELAKAGSAGRSRMTPGRLHHFSHQPRLPQTANRNDLSVVAVAEEILARGSSGLHARGVALLVTGKSEKAVAALEEAVRILPTDPVLWSDLSAALAALSTRSDDGRIMARAVAAADQALRLNPHYPAAQFNRAVALQIIGHREEAIRAYEAFIESEPESAWAAEARRTASSLRASLESWADDGAALRDAAARADKATVRSLVGRYRQYSRTWSETKYLAQWGRAVLGRDRDAERQLAIVRSIADALREQSGETFLADAVAIIDAAHVEQSSVAILARAHVDYDEGRRLYGERDLRKGMEVLQRSKEAFRTARSPFVFAAEHFAANAAFDQFGSRDAAAQQRALLDRLPEGYKALRAQAYQQLGTIHALQGELPDAVANYTRAMETFEGLGESPNVIATGTAIARILSLEGRPHESWRFRKRIFTALGSTNDSRMQQLALGSAAFDAAKEHDFTVARALLTLALDIPERQNRRRRLDLLLARARAAARTGDHELADTDLRRARMIASSLPDQAMARASANEISVTEASLIRDREPARSAAILSDCIRFTMESGRTMNIADLYLERARALRALQQTAAAKRDYLAAVDVLENRRRDLVSDASGTYAVPNLEAYTDLASLHLSEGDMSSAFQIADMAKQWRFIDYDPAQPVTIAEVQNALLPGSVLLHYTTTPGDVLLFTVTRESVSLARLPATAVSTSSADVSRMTREAGRQLLGPAREQLRVARRVIVVPDGSLALVPFAALVNPATGQALIETAAVALAPTAARFTRRAPAARQARSALIIADPWSESPLDARLPRLHAAAQEGKEVASLYGDSELLRGAQATKTAFMSRMRGAGVIHIAAHAEIHGNPLTSALLLAPGTAQSGALTAREIIRSAPLGARMVVLAGCRTADSGGGGGVGGLATAFLAAGADHAVGTLWDVDDRAARAFSTNLHQLLREGADPDEAVRGAQLRLARSTDPSLNALQAWASFQLHIRSA